MKFSDFQNNGHVMFKSNSIHTAHNLDMPETSGRNIRYVFKMKVINRCTGKRLFLTFNISYIRSVSSVYTRHRIITIGNFFEVPIVRKLCLDVFTKIRLNKILNNKTG